MCVHVCWAGKLCSFKPLGDPEPSHVMALLWRALESFIGFFSSNWLIRKRQGMGECEKGFRG